jgi:hypothetical protein
MDQRRHARHPATLRMHVRLPSGDRRWFDIENLSAGGALLVGDWYGLRPGACYRFVASLRLSDKLVCLYRLTGEVVHCSPAGVGLRFCTHKRACRCKG